MNRAISFKTVTEKDFVTLHQWLNEAHILEFFTYKPMALEQVVEKYGARLKKGHPTKMHLALVNGLPFGYLQSYRIADYPEFSKDIQESHGFSIDFFIGKRDFLGRGLGAEMIRSYIAYLSKNEFPEEQHCFICHRENNLRAISTSKGAGLLEVRRVIEEGHPCLVLGKEI